MGLEYMVIHFNKENKYVVLPDNNNKYKNWKKANIEFKDENGLKRWAIGEIIYRGTQISCHSFSKSKLKGIEYEFTDDETSIKATDEFNDPIFVKELNKIKQPPTSQNSKKNTLSNSIIIGDDESTGTISDNNNTMPMSSINISHISSGISTIKTACLSTKSTLNDNNTINTQNNEISAKFSNVKIKYFLF